MTDRKQAKRSKDNSNSATAALQQFSNAQTTIPLPEPVEFTSEIEIQLWEYVTASRSYDDWRDVDLMMLWKWVKLECELLAQQSLLDTEGVVVEGARGGPIENPRVRIMHLYEQRQLSIFRALGLNITKADSRTVKKHAAGEQKARRVLSAADSLLAGAKPN